MFVCSMGAVVLKRTAHALHFSVLYLCCMLIGGGGDDLQRNLQKELESKLSKFRVATFTPTAAAEAKTAGAQ